MVARPGTYQASNNAGELKEELHGRTDLKQYYAGLAYARNVEPVPQGGSRLSPRSRHHARLRRSLAAQAESLSAEYRHSLHENDLITAATFQDLQAGSRLITGAFVGTIVAETIAANSGIGYVMVVATNTMDGALAFAALSVLAVMGVALYAIAILLEKRLTGWAYRG